jgi:Ca2+-binding RTX toxin-like protein
VNAGAGNDTIVATIGDGFFDFYNGGSGTDTIDLSGITASVTVDLAQGFVSSFQTGIDTLFSIENVIGGSGNDDITGDEAANRIEGGRGDDKIDAASGNDVVIGGAGNDTMNGGPGNDVFIFAPGFGNDRVLGFDANPSGGQDFLDISAFGITKTTFATRVKIADIGADTLVTIDGNVAQTIRLVGIGDATSVTQADFIL